MNVGVLFGGFVVLAIIAISILYFVSPSTLGIETEDKEEEPKKSTSPSTTTTPAVVEVEAAQPALYVSRDFVQITGTDTDLPDQPITNTLSGCITACESDNTCIGFSREKSKSDTESSQCYLKKSYPTPYFQHPVYKTFTKPGTVYPEKPTVVTTTSTTTSTTTPATTISGYVKRLSTLFTSPAGYTPGNYVNRELTVGGLDKPVSLETCKTICDTDKSCNAIAYENGTCYFQTIPNSGSTPTPLATFTTYLKGTVDTPTPR